MSVPPSFIKINASALAHNVHRIRQIAPHSKILAMIKARAYGHGLVEIARSLPEVEGFGVACLEEAIELRKADITQKIVVMRGILNPAELEIANQFKLDIVIHQVDQLHLLSRQTHWLKINTGMNRLGFLPEELIKIYKQLKNSNLHDLILMTHFPSAEEIFSKITSEQMQCFAQVTQSINYPKSLANSAAILNFPESHQDWIRPGLILYGVSPIENKTASDFDLHPVMTWRSQLIAVRFQKKGDAIGYNGLYRCEENMPVGIVGVGYADGYPRHARNGTPILVNGVEVPLAGRVSMDMLAVDLRKIPDAKVHNPVTLWGEGLPVEKVASYTASNVYELLCGVRPRGKFYYVE